jgi:hypothetical protein
MTILRDRNPESNPAPAELWPSIDEVDGWVWNPTDARWAAESFGSDFDDDDRNPDDFADFGDAMALESHAQDCLERGLICQDVAEMISKTSLVGHDDAGDVDAAECYRRTAERLSGRAMSREAAEQALSLAWFHLSTGR